MINKLPVTIRDDQRREITDAPQTVGDGAVTAVAGAAVSAIGTGGSALVNGSTMYPIGLTQGFEKGWVWV